MFDPNDPRYRQMVTQMMRSGQMPPGMSMESQVSSALGQPLPPGMMKPYIDQAEKRASIDARSQDITGQENKIKGQRAYADMLRGREMPQGRSVGPLDVYMAPNWGETLAGAMNPVIGGLVAQNANKKDVALDEKRTALKRALAEKEQAEYDAEQEWKRRNFDYQVGRDNTADEQWKLEYDADQLERLRSAELDAAGQEPIEFLDTDNQKRQVMPSWDEESRKVVYLDENKNTVDITGWERQYRSYGSGGGGGTGTTKYPTRWVNVEGDEVYTYSKDGIDYDRDTHEPMPNGWISSGGFFAEDAISGSGRNSALKAFNKDTQQLRQVVTDYQDMLGVFKKYDVDLFAGDDPLGRFEKDEGAVGDFTRMLQDASVEGAPTGEMYSATRAVLNAIIRQQAGLSQTQPEIEKLNKQYGTRWVDDPAIMSEALKRLGPKLKMDIGQAVSQLDDKSLDLYRERMGRAGIPDWTQWSVSKGFTPPDNKSGRGHGATANKTKILTEADIDNMTIEELREHGLI